ncbi:MAG TPA: calcium/sodium antiporter [Saprospiraceae bacterium]|nr:calcium/sodium antiporter [Saprospiraceae bacterium]HMQ85409.1 calcium/sodium antiporter [Saprospiraceae bacterium]
MMLLLKFVGGLVVLIVGAEVFVKGASRIAAMLGIPPLVIGLTVVAFGTSSPELAVSLMSSMEGSTGIALGNVVGSNIFNVLFILGITSLILPLVVAQQLIRLDVPIMIATALIALGFALDGTIRLWEGLVLLLIGIAYVVFLIRMSKQEKDPAVLEEYREEYALPSKKVANKKWFFLLLILVGLGMLILGSRWLVDSAILMAQSLGISEMVIGLTIIAAGTSLPEVATSIIASIRGERDIAVGNVVGSNIFNIVFILGIVAVVGNGVPVTPAALWFDLPVMVAVSLACMPIFFTGKRLDRWEGFVFLGYYLAYVFYLILKNAQYESLKAYTVAMTWFVIPLTILTLVVMSIREFMVNGKGTKK